MKKAVVILVIAAMLLAVFTPVTMAWLSNHIEQDSSLTASSMASYFGGGDGSATTPYIINNPRHLYNLAWLQDKGIFNDGIYHFK